MSQLSAPNYQVLDGGGGHTTASAILPPIISSNRAYRVAQSQGKYSDAVMRGRVWTGCTAATGVAPGQTISTTAAFSLYNPIGSGVNAVCLRASLGYVSGTIGAGSVMFTASIVPTAAATTGTAIVPYNNLIGGGVVGNTCKPLTTATIPVTGLLLRPAWALNEIVIATTALNTEQNLIDLDGEFIVSPGCTLSFQGLTAAGSSPLVIFGLTWEEVGIN